MIISIDGGTTNTRIALVDNGGVIDRVKISIGARDNAADFKKILGEEIKRLLEKNKVEKREISFVTASGMITSDAGLLNVAHIIAPAGRTELSQSKKEMFFDEIFHLPVTFIPGIKVLGENLLDTDVMRGEETEVMGLFAYDIKPPFTAVLPGSHTKIVSVNRDGKIENFCTCMSGELIRAVSENTIISRSLNGIFPKKADVEMLKTGYEYAKKNGFNSAVFKVRILDLFNEEVSPEKLYGFLLGAVLQDDIERVLRTSDETVVIAGSDPFRSAYEALLKDTDKKVITLKDDIAENLAAIGAYKIMVQ